MLLDRRVDAEPPFRNAGLLKSLVRCPHMLQRWPDIEEVISPRAYSAQQRNTSERFGKSRSLTLLTKDDAWLML
jgi:hypothetical protein